MAASRTPLIVALAAITAACALFAVIAGFTSEDDDSVTATPSATVTTVAGAGGTTAPPASGAGTAVDIQDFSFTPQEVQVAVGSAVTWKNLDGFAHSVRSSDQSFGSDNLDQGATFEFTFTTAGSFAYVCGIHPSMSGTVVVG